MKFQNQYFSLKFKMLNWNLAVLKREQLKLWFNLNWNYLFRKIKIFLGFSMMTNFQAKVKNEKSLFKKCLRIYRISKLLEWNKCLNLPFFMSMNHLFKKKLFKFSSKQNLLIKFYLKTFLNSKISQSSVLHKINFKIPFLVFKISFSICRQWKT